MNPGLFKKRITFQGPPDPERTNENGFPMEDWQDVKSVWAMIKTLNDIGSSFEFNEAATTYSKNTCSFIIRFTTGIDTNMRIVYNGRFFEILSVVNDNELNKTLTIIGREVI